MDAIGINMDVPVNATRPGIYFEGSAASIKYLSLQSLWAGI